MSPWHPLIGDPDSAPDDAKLDRSRSASESQTVGVSDIARSPIASASPLDAGERATFVGSRWFEDEPDFLQQPETSRANIDRPAEPIALPMKPARTKRTLRALVVNVLRAVLTSLEKDH